MIDQATGRQYHLDEAGNIIWDDGEPAMAAAHNYTFPMPGEPPMVASHAPVAGISAADIMARHDFNTRTGRTGYAPTGDPTVDMLQALVSKYLTPQDMSSELSVATKKPGGGYDIKGTGLRLGEEDYVAPEDLRTGQGLVQLLTQTMNAKAEEERKNKETAANVALHGAQAEAFRKGGGQGKNARPYLDQQTLLTQLAKTDADLDQASKGLSLGGVIMPENRGKATAIGYAKISLQRARAFAAAGQLDKANEMYKDALDTYEEAMGAVGGGGSDQAALAAPSESPAAAAPTGAAAEAARYLARRGSPS